MTSLFQKLFARHHLSTTITWLRTLSLTPVYHGKPPPEVFRGSNWQPADTIKTDDSTVPFGVPDDWDKYNRIVYPPAAPGEEPRAGYVNHCRTYIRGNIKKYWFLAQMVRGMSVDEAVKQLSFHKLPIAIKMRDTLIEAQEMAVKEHNIEYKSNLWVSQSYIKQALIVKGLRRRPKYSFTAIHYRYFHYMIRLEEGPAPGKEGLYGPQLPELNDRLNKRLEYLNNRKLLGTIA
ncbi:unnamed protein product [Rotaria socialis]|uniref:Large ribosomal subunit protein uL22m n=1 Tax=Rotaria socialis TaxID=392032 RepID=A0A817L7T1_9BILA|nr:unnamed protein product [Rotaria socialis]CAF3178616.1 unnamed protein product [Rotaria socialis]CAF3323833.1 unnamed protein product [Rotaria socialis]CAF3330950.1 unnamed protein product [Rotaria socialis]CAF3487210.1 unnamed protein product [Rotaria socialis]